MGRFGAGAVYNQLNTRMDSCVALVKDQSSTFVITSKKQVKKY